MKKLRVHDLDFEVYLEEYVLKERVAKMALEIHRGVNGKIPHFVAILNGSFVFASDLLRSYPGECKISFVKLNSYEGLKSSGIVHELIGLGEISDKEQIVVLEDIVDTGHTLMKIDEIFKNKAMSYKLASLFFKPEAYKGNQILNFVGFEIPNNFIVGYGLDYNGFGRNLKHVYQLAKAQT
jgi:hypoxanthine phosphoribosyltransferase